MHGNKMVAAEGGCNHFKTLRLLLVKTIAVRCDREKI